MISLFVFATLGCAGAMGCAVAAPPGGELSPSTPWLAQTASPTPAAPDFTLLPVGVNNGDRNLLPSLPVFGQEDGKGAVNFEQWLIPFRPLVTALGYQIAPQADGLWELRSSFSMVRIDPKALIENDRLGQTISIAQIRQWLNLGVRFDSAEYALVFDLAQNRRGLSYRSKKDPPKIDLTGLPIIHAPGFAISSLSQNLLVTGGDRQATSTQGNLIGIGSLGRGSWFFRLNQPQMDRPRRWQLGELQYLQQTPKGDLVLGTQPTFWQNRRGQFVGLTLVRRWGFEPLASFSNVSGGFSPHQRLASNRVLRSIDGRADPGTLVRLVGSNGNEILGEILVDGSGRYRFDHVESASGNLGGSLQSNDYRLYLYPKGQLSAIPEIRDITYSQVGGQLSPGTAALIASFGSSRRFGGNNTFLGTLQDFRGGLAYRWGMTNSLTLGTGLVYDQHPFALGEMFFQPANLDLRFTGNLQVGLNPQTDWAYSTKLDYRLNRDLDIALDSDRNSHRFRANWRLLPGLSLNANWDSLSQKLNLLGGVGFSMSGRNQSTNIGLNLNRNNQLSWNFNTRSPQWEFQHRGNELGTSSELLYQLGKPDLIKTQGSQLFLNYLTNQDINRNNAANRLFSFGWRYRSGTSTNGYENLRIDLSYGLGNLGQGFSLSFAKQLRAGMYLTVNYHNIALDDNSSRFSINLANNFSLQPRLGFGSLEPERMRSQGGLAIQAFYDKNRNGRRDLSEDWYTDSIAGLVLLNNQPIQKLSQDEPDRRDPITLFRLAPDSYRLDFDPSGTPFGWKISQTAYRLEVSAGAYTPLDIPLVPAYALTGFVRDRNGDPVEGRRVEAIAKHNESDRRFSITNRAGIFYLENLELGEYQLLVGGEPVQPDSITFTPEKQPLNRLDIQLAN